MRFSHNCTHSACILGSVFGGIIGHSLILGRSSSFSHLSLFGLLRNRLYRGSPERGFKKGSENKEKKKEMTEMTISNRK